MKHDLSLDGCTLVVVLVTGITMTLDVMDENPVS